MADNVSVDYLENTSVLYGPEIHLSSFPNHLENTSVLYGPEIREPHRPEFIDNSQVFYIARVGSVANVAEPDFTENVEVFYSPTVNFKIVPVFIKSTNVVYLPSSANPITIFPDFIDKTATFGRPIVNLLPFDAPLVLPDKIFRPTLTLPPGETSTTGSNRVFKDFSAMFSAHPLTGDITRVFDYDSVTQALKMIIFTEFYERPFSSQKIATGINTYLFEPNDATSRREIQERIASAIIGHEPRVIVEEIIVEQHAGNPYAINVTVTYKIRTMVRLETFSLFIERV